MKSKPVTKEELVVATLALIALKDNLRRGLTSAQTGAAVDVIDQAVDALGRAAAQADQRAALPEDFVDLFDGVDLSEGQITRGDLKLAAQKLQGLRAAGGDVWADAEVAMEIFYHAAAALWPTLPEGE